MNKTTNSICKNLLYKHNTLLKYYKSNIIIFGYMSYNIHMSIVYSNLFDLI